MSRVLKVIGGTPKAESRLGLCGTCSHSMIRRDVQGHEAVRCSIGGGSMRQPLVECSSWEDKREPSLWDMRQIAWMLTTSEDKKAVGFRPPKKDEDD